MKTPLLSSGDICRVVDMAPNTLDEWCRKQIVVPVEGGEGHGSHRRFTKMQSLGLAVARELQRGERGCCLSYVGQVVAAFAETNEDALLQRFDAGATHFVLVHYGKPILDGANYPEWVDVAKLHRAVTRKIAKLSKVPKNPAGRSRGLASAE